ncbi:MAG: diphthamide biosynthesis enzyme Dph2 [Candidatus Hodarchaeales archaeon]|jgi:2-(3-amino-3-carboxypropyl)histidine synthase
MEIYDIDYNLIEKEINKLVTKPKTILLQFPDGLLGPPQQKVVNFLTELGIDSVISADPSYGACDLPTFHSEFLKTDLIFHFGHSTFAFPPPLKFKEKIVYFPVKVNIDIKWMKIVREIKNLGWNNVGLLTTIQHSNLFDFGKKIFNDHALTLLHHKEGQILGCNQDRATKIADKVDGFLVIAGGDFHASPIVIATNRPTIRYDPFRENIKLFDEKFKNKYLSQRYAQIEKARKAKNWGVLLSSKSGQMPKDQGKRLINMLMKFGVNVTPFIMNRVDFNHLVNFTTIDAWVITLCPRLATDDYINLKKPILTSRELSVLVGDLSWERFITPQHEEHLLTIEEFN